MEHVGFDPTRVHGTVHNRAYYFINQQQRKGSIEVEGVDSEFHIYSIEWTPESITIFADGSPYFHYVNDGSGWESWSFDHPYHLILNLAIGGAWGRAGGPIDNSMFPARMEVDSVRVFKRVAEPIPAASGAVER
jgi:beta-glucanase (GH16 family)